MEEINSVGQHNPHWTRTEILLALDLYFRIGVQSATHPEVVALSEFLNQLPIHERSNDKFRNPNGVNFKLSNFRSVDPGHPGRGSSNLSKLDRSIFLEFHNRSTDLQRLVAAIRSEFAQGRIPELPESEEVQLATTEGELLLRRHLVRERNGKVVRAKKNQVKELTGRLACEICDLDFSERYGETGEGFIECHHLIPLAGAGPRETKTADLALMCANCHRMVHRMKPFGDLDKLRKVLRSKT